MTDKKCNVEGLKMTMKFLCGGLIRSVINVEGLKVMKKFLFEGLIRNVILRG